MLRPLPLLRYERSKDCEAGIGPSDRSASSCWRSQLLIVSVVLASARLRLGSLDWVTFTLEGGYAKTWLIAVVVQLCLYFADLYDSRSRCPRAVRQARPGTRAASFCLAVVTSGSRRDDWPGVFVIAAVLTVAIVGGWRLTEHWISGHNVRERRPRRTGP